MNLKEMDILDHATTFPPPSDFENFCECFLRTASNPTTKFVTLLHTTMYSGARSSAPTEGELNSLLSAANNQKRQEEPQAPEPQRPGRGLARAPLAASGPVGPGPSAPSGPRPGAPVAAQPSIDMTIEYHYIDASGGQCGPAPADQLKAAWKAGTLHKDCICWHANLSGWEPIHTQQQLFTYLSS